jgi:hypothetical protein
MLFYTWPSSARSKTSVSDLKRFLKLSSVFTELLAFQHRITKTPTFRLRNSLIRNAATIGGRNGMIPMISPPIVQQVAAQLGQGTPRRLGKIHRRPFFLSQKQLESQRFLKIFFDFCIFMLKLHWN